METPSASQASLGKVGVGASAPPQLLGPPRVLPRRKAAAAGPLPRMGLPSSASHVLFWPCPHPQAGHTLGAQLAGSPALEQEQQCLVRTQNDHLGGDLSSLVSSEDFFASLENDHLWASISSLFYSAINCSQNLCTDCLHCHLKEQVQLMLREPKCHGSVKTDKTSNIAAELGTVTHGEN